MMNVLLKDSIRETNKVPKDEGSNSNLCKRKRTDEENEYKLSNKAVMENYYKFQKSGTLKSLMYHQNGEWIALPKVVIDEVKEGFFAKHAIIEVETPNHYLLFDMIHLIKVDVKTAIQYPLAWIDNSGNCFFPQVSGTHKIEDGIEESNVNSKRSKKFDEKLVGNLLNKEVKFEGVNPKNVKNLFLEGMFPWRKVEVMNISKCLIDFDLFEKVSETVKNLRGKSNIQYGWLVISKDSKEVMNILGLGNLVKNSPPQLYPISINGVHLNSVTSAHNSVNYCDIDENGISTMILCRVILGNVEAVYCGSHQTCPSSEEFDSGVDDLDKPSQYIVWDKDVKTRIYPEYSVSFRLLPGSSNEGTSQKVENLSEVTSQGMKIDLNKLPRSPWMPFPMLFQAISNKVPREKMKVVYNQYNLFRGKKMNKEEFVRRLRLVVGDGLLKSTIVNLQFKMPSNSGATSVLKVVKEEREE